MLLTDQRTSTLTVHSGSHEAQLWNKTVHKTCHLIQPNKLRKKIKASQFQSGTEWSFQIHPKRRFLSELGGGGSKVTFLLTQQHAVVNFHFHSHPSGATKHRFISQLQM